MSKFLLQDKNTKLFISSSAGRVFEVVKEIKDAAFFNTKTNAEKALKKMYSKDGEAKVSQTRFVTKDFVHILTFNSEKHKKESEFEGAENLNVLKLDLVIREVKFTLI